MLVSEYNFKTISPIHFLQLLSLKRIPLRSENGDGRFFIYGYNFYEYTLNNIDSLINKTDRFIDNFSKFTWLSLLKYRLTLDPNFLYNCGVGYNPGSFFNAYPFDRNYLNFSSDEVFVDAGAFDGHTIELFIAAVNGKFKKIYSYEPSTQSNLLIQERLVNLRKFYLDDILEKIVLIQKGLWSTNTTLKFNPYLMVKSFDEKANANAGHFIDTGISSVTSQEEERISESINVTTIDTSTDLDATLIKFEIEGSELEALKGAEKTIQKNRPRIALSIYHKPEDLDTLMDFMINQNLDYKYGFRQYNPFCPDASVVYCF